MYPPMGNEGRSDARQRGTVVASPRANEQVVINVTPDDVYDMVADLPRMGEWSPEVPTRRVEGGATGPAQGAQFRRPQPHRSEATHSAGRVGAVSSWLTAAGSSRSSPRKDAASPPSGATGSSRSKAAAPGSPKGNDVKWLPALGPGSSTVLSTGAESCTTTCATRSLSSRPPPRRPRWPRAGRDPGGRAGRLSPRCRRG